MTAGKANDRSLEALRIFERSLDHSPDERKRFVQNACAGDRELEQDVLELLAQDAKSPTLPIDQLAGELRIEAQATDESEALHTPLGSITIARGELEGPEMMQRLAAHRPAQFRYEVQSEVARGGMGTVLRVWDPDLRRTLAMKRMLEPASSEPTSTSPRSLESLGRFLEEAQVTGQLDHPGIVPVHELGLDEHGAVFFTMRLVKGREFREIIDLVHGSAGEWTLPRALGVLQRVCEAVAYAHTKRVVHRDLKPANLMVGRFGEVYVMDWGLARVLDQVDSKDIRIRPEDPDSIEIRSHRQDVDLPADVSPLYTMDGDVVGTPAYMAPEQALGRIDDLGPRADIYSLGAILYHLLGGSAPYIEPGTRVGGYAVLARVQHGPPRPLHELCPEQPAELLAICERAMARQPEERYSHVGQLSDDLAAFLEGRVVQAYETGAWAEARKWMQRNRALAQTLAVTALVVVGGLAGIGYVQAEGRQVAEDERTIARNERLRAESGERAALQLANQVLQLSALPKLADLREQAAELWPPFPEQITSYEAWMTEATGFLAQVEELDAEATTLDQAEIERALQHLNPLDDEAGRTIQEAREKSRWAQREFENLSNEVGSFRADTIGLFGANGISPEHGWSIPKRLDLARKLQAGFAPGQPFAAAWKRDLDAIRESCAGQPITPCLGLVPIGPDPDSGLWEFWHIASGDEPQRDADEHLVVVEATGLVFVLIPGGSFHMGAQPGPTGLNPDPQAKQDEAPVHPVELSPFFLSKFEMTQAQWKRLVGWNDSACGPDSNWKPDFSRTLAVPDGTLPVTNVSWVHCDRALKRFGLALPTEAQWEFACRGGSATVWWSGQDRESLAGATNLADRYARDIGGVRWGGIQEWLDDGFEVQAPIGTYAPNPFGLHEIHGNVWEWCADGYDDQFYARSPLRDPFADPRRLADRVYRGGSFFHPAVVARSAARTHGSPTVTGKALGLRPMARVELE